MNMPAPTVISTIKDPELDITYRVAAYRSLTREELVLAVRMYRGQKKQPKDKRGTVVTIVTIIGADGR